jgi:hypothetical protein
MARFVSGLSTSRAMVWDVKCTPLPDCQKGLECNRQGLACVQAQVCITHRDCSSSTALVTGTLNFAPAGDCASLMINRSIFKHTRSRWDDLLGPKATALGMGPIKAFTTGLLWTFGHDLHHINRLTCEWDFQRSGEWSFRSSCDHYAHLHLLAVSVERDKYLPMMRHD